MAFGFHSIGLALTITASLPADNPAPPLNARILSFAHEHLGQKVGDGQCTSLAFAAYRRAGARRFPPFGPEAEYVWGEYVEKADDVRPGDVLQFQDVIFKGRRRQTRRGRVVIVTYERTFPHHTAIVEEVRDGGRRIVILHQNTGPTDASPEDRMIVQRDELRMADLKHGTIRAYRPVAE